MMALVALVILPLVGCSGGSTPAAVSTQKGVQLTVGGNVSDIAAKSTAKSTALVPIAMNTVEVSDAQTGTSLGTSAIAANGSFSLSFTLPTAKTILVFKATVSQGSYLSIVPIDLSNPPAAGAITGNNTITVTISADTTAVAKTVSAMLGLTGDLGDAGMTLASVNKTYADAAQLVVDNGGQVLAYSATGLALTGKVSNTALLPAVDANTFSFDDLNNIALDGKVISAYIPNNKAIVNFQVTNKATGKGVRGLKTFGLYLAVNTPANDATGAPSDWKSYMVSSATGSPSGDSGYTVIDKGDGTYTVNYAKDVTSVSAFNGNVTYDKNKIHRVVVQVRSSPSAPINPATGATSSNFGLGNPANLIYDFIPGVINPIANTNQYLAADNVTPKFARDIVTTAACNQCHFKIGVTTSHGGRLDTRYCVVCHTSQLSRGTLEFVKLIHNAHGDVVNETSFPQDARNCVMCHKGTDVDNWKTQPSILACGTCHTGTDFASHQGGQANNQFCKGCHAGVSAIAEVSAKHIAVIPPDPNNIFSTPVGGNSRTNAAYVAAAGVVPPGAAKITYNIASSGVTVGGTPKRASIKFQILKDGVAQTLNTYVDATTQLLPGFVGSTNIYVAYAVPQDGITAPADFNKTINVYLKDLMNPANTKGVLSGPDASKYYTVTLGAGAAATASDIPDSAVMVTGGIGYAYSLSATTQPFTQIDIAAYPFDAATKVGGLIVAAPNVWQTAVNYTGRRSIVTNAKCNACHVQLGVKPSFHVGQRNDAPTCSFCHNPNTASSGYSANASTFIHGIHGKAKRSTQFGWHAVSATDGYWNVVYPGYLRNCEQCHAAQTYDFSSSAYNGTTYKQGTTTNVTGPALQDRLLYTTVAYGTSAISSLVPPANVNFSTSTVYGAAFSYDAATNTTVPFADTTLVTSPVTAACFSCHDSKLAKAHMINNGGSIYEARSTALLKSETCLVCHGPAANTLNSTVPTIKAVHRWW
jgi:OmcA/MtrC family decaheme c-type cytochrome